MTRTTRLTEQLTWASYKEQYRIGQIMVEALARDSAGNIIVEDDQPKVVKAYKFVNELKDAIDAGVFDKLVEDCAEAYHAGNTAAVYYAIGRNLDSQRHHMKKRVEERGYAPNLQTDKIRLDTMTEYVNSHKEAKNGPRGNTPQWAYGPTEIDAIDDIDKLQKVINSINDVASDAKANKAYVERLGDSYKEVAKANREYARKRKAALQAKETEIDPAILQKLASGGKVTLTADQAAALAKLLGK